MKLLLLTELDNVSFRGNIKLVKILDDGTVLIESLPHQHNTKKTIELISDGFVPAVVIKDKLILENEADNIIEVIELPSNEVDVKNEKFIKQKKLILINRKEK